MLCTTKRLLNASWRRAYSAQPSRAQPYPFRNLRALPFVVSPEAAQNRLSLFASTVLLKNIFQSLLCWCFPEAGFSPIRPVRLQPVYFPAWFLDVELQGQVTINGHDRQASAQITHAYIPGSDYKALSSASLMPYKYCFGKIAPFSVPFSEDLLRQHDVDIACIPYNISPFSILDVAGDLSSAEATVAPGFRLNLSTLKANLFAAYPILMPLYLAQYEVETKLGKRLHTLVIEASETTVPAVWSEPLTGEFEKLGRYFKTIQSSFNLPEQFSQSIFNMVYPKRFVEEVVGFSVTPHKTLGKSLGDYLEKAINHPGAATILAAASAHGFGNLANDRRIRAFTPEECNPVSEWLKLGSEMAMIERMQEALSETRELRSGLGQVSGGKQPNQEFLNKSIDSLLDKFTALRVDRLRIKPHWAKSQEELDQEGKTPV